jgi:hypothetical protein
VLEDGMTFKQVSWSPKESEYTAARKLSRTECAAAYHIPPPFVGDLEHATFCLPGDAGSLPRETARREIRAGDGVWVTADTWTLSPVTRSRVGDDEILALHGQWTVRLNATSTCWRRGSGSPRGGAMAIGHRRAMGRAHKRWVTSACRPEPPGRRHHRWFLAPPWAAPQATCPRAAAPSVSRALRLLLGDANVSRVRGPSASRSPARRRRYGRLSRHAWATSSRRTFSPAPVGRSSDRGGRQTRLMSVAVGPDSDDSGSAAPRTKRVGLGLWIAGSPASLLRVSRCRRQLRQPGSCRSVRAAAAALPDPPSLSERQVPSQSARAVRANAVTNRTDRAFSQWTFTCSIGRESADRIARLNISDSSRRASPSIARDRYPWQGGRGFASETTQLSAIRADRSPADP